MEVEKIAFDGSVRSKDADGRLHVKKTVISKAAVNQYRGSSIPNWQELGLDPDKIYSLLRDPDELERAAASFERMPLMLNHVFVNADKPEKERVIGAIGSSWSYEDGKLYYDLVVNDSQAVALVESGKMQEISAAYRYVADMQSGEWQGIPFDGVMRQMSGNHVALVEHGRIGSDAIICDELPLDMRSSMKLKKGGAEAIQKCLVALGMDEASVEQVKEVTEEVAKNIEHKPAWDEAELRKVVGDKYDEVVKLVGGKADTAEDEDEGEKAKAERKKLEDTDKDDREAKKDDKAEKAKGAEDTDKEEKTAMDAADIEQRTMKRMVQLHTAIKDVEPLVGVIAMDSMDDASAVYAYALGKKGVTANAAWGVEPLKALVQSTIAGASKGSVIAQDSTDFKQYKPKFKRGI